MNTQQSRSDGVLGLWDRTRVLTAALTLAILATVFATSMQAPDVPARVVEEVDVD